MVVIDNVSSVWGGKQVRISYLEVKEPEVKEPEVIDPEVKEPEEVQVPAPLFTVIFITVEKQRDVQLQVLNSSGRV